ncbi:MAG: hypothetical protein KF871_06380 [Hydrogenophaga sp.]|uniref:PhaM family polyhydroxyalkanoate granule multifunctional regulatory protein n=1 Tax=Hydrogenophaga sp. TaxID=1904254 RepID=UPI001E1781B6|nr:PhaM family polyhydroxyalkanoate granule multifunctional regulatory protein [Hydrogenophaga sp.]MBX3609508.1 hypothetical protein [Hydrogenophaga sp.]
MSDVPTGGFGRFVPGFEFLQNLASQAAGGIAQGIGQNLPQMPSLSNWVAPTFNVEELEKRIDELKAVHFWLDQNAKALGATIQALEVQKMTLSTLKSMNFSLGDVAGALKVKDAAPSGSGTRFAGLEIPPKNYGDPVPPAAKVVPKPARKRAAPRKSASQSASDAALAGGVVDPMQWWGALSQQFQQIATNAMKDAAKQTALDTTRQVATDLTGAAVRTASGLAGQAARTAAGTVGRGVGTAAGVGRAAARALNQAPAAKSPSAKSRVAPARKSRQK